MSIRDTPRPLVITGPTGWIGTALLAALAETRGPRWADRVRLFGSSARAVVAPDGMTVAMRALEDITPADVADADVVHLAYLTKEKVAALGAARFFAANAAIDDALLSAMQAARPHAVFVASSGAAKLAEDGRDRHLYGVAKLLQEDRFLEFGRAAAVPVLAGRIFNIAGPYINKVESYAVASFLTQAIGSGRIRIAADCPVYRAYLHVGDLARLALAAVDGAIGAAHAIDLCGGEVVEMIDIARLASDIIGIPHEAIERPALDLQRSQAYLGDPVATRNLALHCNIELLPLTKQMQDTAYFLRR